MRAAGLAFGHGTDNALDEAVYLVLHALNLPQDLDGAYGDCRLTDDEAVAVEGLLDRRIKERLPAPYLTGSAWFAGLEFKVDARVLVPRSPIGELVEQGFSPWLDGTSRPRVLDLCTGSGCIGIATAVWCPQARVDAIDNAADALAVAAENLRRHGVGDRVALIESDLFAAVAGRTYDLIVSNPPYVGLAEWQSLPDEYRHEPDQALRSGDDGLDLPLRILSEAPDHLGDQGSLILEVGHSWPALAAALGDIEPLWLDFERGGEGVLAVDRETLRGWQPVVAALLEGRR